MSIRKQKLAEEQRLQAETQRKQILAEEQRKQKLAEEQRLQAETQRKQILLKNKWARNMAQKTAKGNRALLSEANMNCPFAKDSCTKAQCMDCGVVKLFGQKS